MTRILLADDHEFVRRGVRSLLETHPDFQICGEAVDGREAVEKAQTLRPDVIVLDISMPEMNGLEAARVIHKMLPASEILILSQHKTTEVMNAALTAGARGYIAKSDVARDLLAAVAAVSQHKPVFSGKVSHSNAAGDRFIADAVQGYRATVVTWDSRFVADRSTSSIPKSRDEEMQLRALADNAPVLIWAADPGGQCTFFNQPWLAFAGRSLEEERGTGWTERLHPEDSRNCIDAYFSSIQSGQPFAMEFRLRRADGEYRWLLNNGAPKVTADGVLEGYIGSCVDITERKISEVELRRAHDDLESLVEQRTATLRRLSSRLLQIQDDERRRIARELHDSLGQLLTAAQINLDLCLGSDDFRGDLLNETKALLERSLTETRTLSHLLHPPLLDEAGLDSAIRWYVDGFAKRSGIQVNLDLKSELKRLPSTVEIATFRVLQESLTNVHRHSGSESVDIRVFLDDRCVSLEVQDHGRGLSSELLHSFQKTGFNVGVGLAGMRERVKELGGELNISSDASGTLIRVSIPIGAASKDQPSGGEGFFPAERRRIVKHNSTLSK